MPVDAVSGDQTLEPGVVRRARQAVAASELKLLDAATSAPAGSAGPPAQPTPAPPRDGGLVHVVA
jgi:hypothetical protein